MVIMKDSMPDQTPSCEWTEDASGDYWESACGQTFVFNDGTPVENEIRFCCGCGKPLVQKTAVEAVDDDESREA